MASPVGCCHSQRNPLSKSSRRSEHRIKKAVHRQSIPEHLLRAPIQEVVYISALKDDPVLHKPDHLFAPCVKEADKPLHTLPPNCPWAS